MLTCLTTCKDCNTKLIAYNDAIFCAHCAFNCTVHNAQIKQFYKTFGNSDFIYYENRCLHIVNYNFHKKKQMDINLDLFEIILNSSFDEIEQNINIYNIFT